MGEIAKSFESQVPKPAWHKDGTPLIVLERVLEIIVTITDNWHRWKKRELSKPLFCRSARCCKL